LIAAAASGQKNKHGQGGDLIFAFHFEAPVLLARGWELSVETSTTTQFPEAGRAAFIL